MGGTDRKFYPRKRGGEVMNDILTDLLAIIGVVLNGLPQGLLALAYGFASVPTALAFLFNAQTRRRKGDKGQPCGYNLSYGKNFKRQN